MKARVSNWVKRTKKESMLTVFLLALVGVCACVLVSRYSHIIPLMTYQGLREVERLAEVTQLLEGIMKSTSMA